MNLVHPFTAVIVGPTSSGKKCWVSKLIEHRHEMISPSVEHVIYSYSKWQPLYDKMRDVIFVEGFVPLSRCKQNTLLIIDDQMEQLSPLVADILTKGSHHKEIVYVL